jgi:hypothetical protein
VQVRVGQTTEVLPWHENLIFKRVLLLRNSFRHTRESTIANRTAGVPRGAERRSRNLR